MSRAGKKPPDDERGEGREQPVEQRVDVWLDVACLLPTRSQAGTACAGGKVDVNGQAAKPHRLLKAGDVVALTTPGGRRTFVVRGFRATHVPKAEARTLYEETTPPPTPEERQLRELVRLSAPRVDAGAGRPSKRDRRERERLRGR